MWCEGDEPINDGGRSLFLLFALRRSRGLSRSEKLARIMALLRRAEGGASMAAEDAGYRLRSAEEIRERAEAAYAAGLRLVRYGPENWAVLKRTPDQANLPFLPRRTLALLNSRKPLLPDGTAPWLRATVTLARKAAHDGRVLVSSVGTLTYDIATYAYARAGGRPLLVLPPFTKEPATGSSPVEWLDAEATDWLLPLSGFLGVQRRADFRRERDRLVTALARRLVGVCVRTGGTMVRLLAERLAVNPGEVAVVPGERVASAGVETSGNAELLTRGARRMRLPPLEPPVLDAPLSFADPGAPPAWEHLAHHVAHQDGPWPGETAAEFLESLALGESSSRRDAFQTLLRIVRQRRLRAGTGGLRRQTRAVCFTACSFAESRALHRFDPARGRWLFGPYAVCLRRGVAERLGAAPVIHGSAREFAALPAQERFRFQLCAPPQVDRRPEREWRMPHDVDLSALAWDDVFSLTETPAQAAAIMAAGPWRAWPASKMLSEAGTG